MRIRLPSKYRSWWDPYDNKPIVEKQYLSFQWPLAVHRGCDCYDDWLVVVRCPFSIHTHYTIHPQWHRKD